MKKTRMLEKFTARWWGLPLLLALVMLPVASALSVRLWISDGYVYLIYLPIAMMIAMLMVFDWRAFPGIAVALCFHYLGRYTVPQVLVLVGMFLASLAAGWWGYRTQIKTRWSVSPGELSQVSIRLIWLVLVISTLFVILTQLVLPIGILPLHYSVFVDDSFSLRALLNYQSLLLASLGTVPLFYFSLRLLRNPRFIIMLKNRCQRQISAGVTWREFLLWLVLLMSLLIMLTLFRANQDNLLTTEYGLPLLLPLMLWAALRFGYLFTSLSWGILLVVLYQLRDRFMDLTVMKPYNLLVISAYLLVFTLVILLMSAISTRQRQLLTRAKELALTDPIIGLPNLRALNKDLAFVSCSSLCFLRIPDLDRLSRTYGLRLRIQYKRSLAIYLRPNLFAGESIYQLPGFDLVIRLNHAVLQSRIEELEARIKSYHLSWDGLPIHPDIGLSYCTVNTPVLHLYELLGEMSALAETSLRSGHAVNLQQSTNVTVQRHITEKLAMLHDIQFALQNGSFQLMSQKICGVRGDDYYEILLRMVNTQGEYIQPASFIPVVQEFGLTWEVDRMVLEQALRFIHRHRDRLPGIRFAINLFAATLCRPQLTEEIASSLKTHGVEPWQLIIEVKESPMLSDNSWGNRSLAQLRKLGCRVAIDDFGTGYASYSRLKRAQVDMLKIDGSFVRNMLNNSLDYQIIVSICAVSRLKRMQIVAEFVQTEEVAEELRKLGVDYLQGEIVGMPIPLQDLASGTTEADEVLRP
ncbi:sensor domain-containing phosphodiesterase [Erwinia tasmaniensis]|uniref:Inner membrane protein YfgF n=1 Tax=Erwinia tasmaniensis (strain DSM 17950 / CFBP 7177 / CIP 109463 / NCPPB 4357 / Et1/99) TaxID=465817 RepID=B2VE87_ERWT9|nr:EAL domain-containing protein [Erwinia tasmaniensis]CAO96094.1 Inner membrane protein YfgF [Erwinia tasmaniensis Et1/99]